MSQILDSFKFLIGDVYPALGELEAQEKVTQGILRRIDYSPGLKAAAETVAVGLITFAEKLKNWGFREIYGADFVETVCHLVFCQDLGQSLFPLYEGQREYPLQQS